MTEIVEPRLLPWLRAGLAGHITAPPFEDPASANTATASITIELHASGPDAPDVIEPVLGPGIRLRGPGEIIGFDAALVVRHDPEPGAADAEPNYFPLVELASPDLPWRYSPSAATGDKLRPWIALVVVEERDGVWLDKSASGRLPVLHVDDPSRELPDADQSWAWAHVHADHDLADGLATALTTAPEAFRTRLMCPRRLTANRAWLACVVPTFAAGRDVGLGVSPTTALGLAWDHAASTETLLPVYHSWRFQTGEQGDIESLVRRLKPRELPAGVGRHDLDIGEPGGGLPEAPGTLVTYEGALVSPAGSARAWPVEHRAATKKALRRTINATATRGTIPEPYRALAHDPVVGPPGTAGIQAGVRHVPAEGEPPVWFEELNTEPHRRAVAGVAADVIRRDQEVLMAAAWEQAAALREVNRVLSATRCAWEVAVKLRTSFDRLSDEALLQISGPALTRLSSREGGTVRGAVASSALPAGMVSGALRRMCHTARGLSTRGSDGSRIVPTSAATRAFLAAPVELVNRWALVFNPANADVFSVPGAPIAAARAALSRPSPLPPAGTVTTGPVIVFDGDAEIVRTIVADVRVGLDPAATIRAMLDSRIVGLSPVREHDAPASVFVRPQFTTPMYRRLVSLAVERFMPGGGDVPDDTLGLLEVNQPFVEAFLAGLNHEMGREFRWREYPTSLDSTWFQRFWDNVDGSVDIPPMKFWRGSVGLGSHAAAGTTPPSLVLLITGALLRRYPDVRIYAVEARWDRGKRIERVGGDVCLPVFTGTLRPGMAFFGFTLTEGKARGSITPSARDPGYFFVLEEQPHAPRFGLDAPQQRFRGTAPARWSNLSWAHLSPVEGDLVEFVDTSCPEWIAGAGELTGNGGCDEWGAGSAAMGRITLQRPVRLLVHADSMLPAPARLFPGPITGPWAHEFPGPGRPSPRRPRPRTQREGHA